MMDEDILKQDMIPLDAAGDNASIQSSTKPKKKFQHPIKSADELKREKEHRQARRGRLIVRNISYKSTEKKLRDHFAQFGTVQEVNVLKRSDGKLIGCAFVQFEKVNEAAKAILKCTGKELLGRTVTLDWAVNKDTYVKHVRAVRKVPLPPTAQPIELDASEIKEEEEEEEDGDASIKSEEMSDGGDSDESDQEPDDDEDKKDIKKIKLDADDDDDDEKKPARKLSSDLHEGCTVFIKNVPFDASSNDFKKCCLQFGPIYYALLNKDPVSGHARGTGFVKYRAKESADMCLQAGTEFKLLNQVLDPVVAVSRQDLAKKFEEAKKREPADSRNLYLVKEGLLVAGSTAAEGVSASDMAKRLRLEQIKTQMLKDLNRFLARDRLTVHNIPTAYDSAKLRRVVENVTKLKPKECRVMRENKPTPGAPQGQSKGFGFLAFKSHTEALQCLRKLNNNPNVFSKNNRPIVSFSLEDKSVHNIKKKRLERSQEKNPLFKEKQLRRQQRRKELRSAKRAAAASSVAPPPANGTVDTKVEADDVKPTSKNLRRKAQKAKLKALKQKKKDAAAATDATVDKAVPDFTGVLAEPGTGTMRPRWKIKEQAQIHKKDIDVKKKEDRKNREKKELRAEKHQVDRTKQRQKSGNEVDNFSFMVDKYKKMIDSSADAATTKKSTSKRTKWFTG